MNNKVKDHCFTVIYCEEMYKNVLGIRIFDINFVVQVYLHLTYESILFALTPG